MRAFLKPLNPSDDEPSSAPASAPPKRVRLDPWHTSPSGRSPQQPATTLEKGKLTGRVVLIPRSEWPDEVCEEHGGEGWRGRVTSEDRRSGSVGVKTHDHTYYFAMEAVLSWKALK